MPTQILGHSRSLDDRARQEQQQLEAEAKSPAGRAEAQQSKAEFGDQDRSEALATLDKAFPEVVDAPPFTPLRLRDGDQLMGYMSDYAAKVDGRQGGAQIVQSQLPMRSRQGEDGLKPVSYDMEATATMFRPANPVVETVINKDLDKGIEFPDLGYAIRPSGASSTSEPMRVGDKVLYANLVEDTDLFITPSPTGVSTTLQIRSEQAPERIALQFKMSDGQRLELIDGAEDGVGVRIVDSQGVQVAQIPAPNARDAAGRSVPASYSLEAPNKLVIAYPHKGKGFQYPLAVDPVVDNYAINPAGQRATDYDPYYYWDFYSGDANSPFFPIKGNTGPSAWGNLRGQSGYGNGLYVYNRRGGQFYRNGTQGQWIWGAPGRSFIRRADFGYVTHTPSATCILEGIWAPSRGNWDLGHWDHPTGQPTPRGPSPFFGYQGAGNANSCGRFDNNYKAHYYDPTAGQPNPTPGNQVLFSLYANGDGARNAAIAYMYGASIWLDDADDPAIGAPQLAYQLPGQGCCTAGVPSGWVNGGLFGASADVIDAGLGVNRLTLQVDGQNRQTRTYPCTGGKDNRCPSYWPSSQNNIQYSAAELGDGIHNLRLVGTDVIDHPSSPSSSWQVKVDTTQPTIDQVSGSLYDLRTTGDPGDRYLGGGSYDFSITAHDGGPDGRARAAGSGVRAIDLYVDGQQPDPSSQHAAQSCPQGSCNLALRGSLRADDYGPGDHTITTVVHDGVNQTDTREWHVYVSDASDRLGVPRLDSVIKDTKSSDAPASDPQQDTATDSSFVRGSAASNPDTSEKAAPRATPTFYVPNVSTNAARNTGCAYGHNHVSGVIILDFGAPARSDATVLVGSNKPHSLDGDRLVAQAFGRGYYHCLSNAYKRKSRIGIAIGTSNSGSAANQTQTFGNNLASAVEQLDHYFARAGINKTVSASGAADFEPGFNPPAGARAIASGFTSKTPRSLFNYGSADGCPPTPSSNGTGRCNNGWKQSDLLFVSVGRGRLPLPEIYVQPQVPEWTAVARYAAKTSTRLFIAGVTSEHARASKEFTPSKGWSQLFTALNHRSSTRQSNFPYVTEVKADSAWRAP